MRGMRPRFVLCLCALVGAAATAAAATDVIVIRKKPIEKARIAVPDFTQDGRIVGSGLCAELSEALRFDLDHGGYYRVVGKREFVREAQRKDVESGKVLLHNWRGLEAELVFKTDYRVAGDKFIISCHAYDTSTGRRVFSRRLSGANRDQRRLVHHLSDEILRRLLRAEGIATTRIAFIGENPNGGRDLYVADYDGHNVRRITRDGKVAVSPDWSPDGAQIYYTSTHEGEPYLYRIDLARRRRFRVATFPGLNYAVAVSPNGRKLALVLSKSGTPDIYTMNTDGSDLVRLTKSIGQLSTCPVWSHDGRGIAYVSRRYGSPQLYVMRADGSRQQRLLTGHRYMSSLDWSPTGDIIVFSALVGGRTQLFAADLTTDAVKQLTFDAANHQDPNFAPDGRHIVYVSEPRYGAADLYMLDVLDPRPVRITRLAGNEFYPAWSPTGY